MYRIICRETEETIKYKHLKFAFKNYGMMEKYNDKFSKVNALRREGVFFSTGRMCNIH